MAASSDVHEVRPARPDDVASVVEIERFSFKQPNVGLLMRLCGVTDTLLVDAVDGTVVGYVLSAPTSARLARVISIAVAPEYRGRGVGTALMGETIRLLRSKGIQDIELEVRVSNEPAIGLYRSFGFAVVGTKEGYYDDGEDAYLMRTALASGA